MQFACILHFPPFKYILNINGDVEYSFLTIIDMVLFLPFRMIFLAPWSMINSLYAIKAVFTVILPGIFVRSG